MTAPKFCKSKIIATIGPSSWEKEILKDMILAGMDLARVNASFADYDELKRVKEIVHSISPRISMILDTMGNKIRVSGFIEPKKIEIGDVITLLPETETITNPSEIHITYKSLYKDVSRDATILLDDGNLELTVKDIRDKKVICNAKNKYTLHPKKTVNVPNQELSFPELTDKDIQDIKYAIDLKYDFLALSFVQNQEVVLQTRELLKEAGMGIISKIENQAGIDNFDKILEVSDGIMIARGDLGVEIPYEQIPLIQKQLIYRCRSVGKPVIVATQMLESMRESRHATRAEVSDIANSIIDGTDCLMLSAETSTGKYPVKSIETMNRIALNIEDKLIPQSVYGNTQANRDTDELCKSVFNLTNSMDLSAIIVLSETGKTLQSLSRHRPLIPIFEVSNNLCRVRKDNILRGVKCYYSPNISDDRDQSVKNAVETIFSYGELDFNDKIAIISGSSIKNKDSNTILEIATVKDIIKD